MRNEKVERVADDVREYVWEQLRQRRNALGLSQHKAAELIHPVRRERAKRRNEKEPCTTASDVGRYEGRVQQKRSPPIEYVEAAAEAYGVPYESLFPPPRSAPVRTAGWLADHLMHRRRHSEEQISQWWERRDAAKQRLRAAISVAIGADSRPQGPQIVDRFAEMFWQRYGFTTPEPELSFVEEWTRHLEVLRKPPMGLHELADFPDFEWETYWTLQALALGQLDNYHNVRLRARAESLFNDDSLLRAARSRSAEASPE